MQMIDVHLPTSDGRQVILTRTSQPQPELRLLLDKLKLQTTGTTVAQDQRCSSHLSHCSVVQTLGSL